MMSTTYYELTPSLWPLDGVLQVFALDGKRILAVSVQFLRIGRVLSWEYVQQAVASCIQDQHFELCQQVNDGFIPIDTSTVPSACELFCRLTDRPETTAVLYRTGPRFHYLRRGPDEEDEGTMSHSSRSTKRQNAFRNALLQRDGRCVISGEEDSVTASHILPQSRPEYYEEVLGYDPGFLFRVSFGLLLARDLHYCFDRGQWALYPDPANANDLVVHVFNGGGRMKQWHGKVVPRAYFRTDDESKLPHRGLLQFHYRQCVIKHLRGFSHFP